MKKIGYKFKLSKIKQVLIILICIDCIDCIDDYSNNYIYDRYKLY